MDRKGRKPKVTYPPVRVIFFTGSCFQEGIEVHKKTGFSDQAMDAIEQYAWPGNIRELENRIKRAVIMAEGAKITPADLEMEAPRARYEGMGLKEAREVLERSCSPKPSPATAAT